MIMVVMALIVFAAIFIVGYPLVGARSYGYAESGAPGDDKLEHLASARNSVFDAIRDLEFDHATGKLSDADYQQMRARYDVKAAQVLQQMDLLAGTSGRGQVARGKKTSGAGKCPRCQGSLEPGDRFCVKCGQPVA